MIDFIEYVVAELRSKRLSKADAISLVRQFSRRSSGPAASVIHPLVHRNISDLIEQRYGSTFTGDEFFLADHRFKANGGAGERMLPGVACLEMARAAIEHAVPGRSDSAGLELHNVVWAQPVVANGRTDVSVGLSASDDDEIDFEIYSHDGDQEIVHCQGHAVWSDQPRATPVDLGRLREQLGRGALEPDALYAACARMGVVYGPAFRAITGIQRGDGQVVAALRLPVAVAGTSGDYVLHPSVMDGAVQATVALIDGEKTSLEPRLPFALETLRILSPCTREMTAWVRFAPGSQPADRVVKLDVDVCDDRGNVCVQMRGLSSREVGGEISAGAAPREATPVEASVAAGTREEAERAAEPPRESVPPAGDKGSASLAERTQDYLRREFSDLLGVPAQRIDPRAALEKYGIDSILAMKLTNQLEQAFGSLPKTLFFEYQTIRDLAGYFVDNHRERLVSLVSAADNRDTDVAPTAAPQAPAPAAPSAAPGRRAKRGRRTAREATTDSEPIAIIGLSGRYPAAVDIDAYWRNLSEGRDCITEVPKERWDWREYFSDDRSQTGRHFSKWGGFISGAAEFDPLFFNISPVDAELIDPQERLFLQHAWMAVEDAGYTRATLQVPSAGDLPGQVGVYVGVMYDEYQLFAAEAGARGKRIGIPGSPASIANRVSYALNLHGPSMTLDTMCSSSLTAIHLACVDLRHQRTNLAIAGGVNLSIHPNKYLVLSAGQFISSDGHCQSFGEGGDGYIPGEGVGVVVLKRLSEAIRDGDHIYAIIRGSALTHGGKTNGYSVPNPQAQTSAISRALEESRVDARHVSYVEAHGTGTRLGDPIEIAALSKAFQRYTRDTQFCLIGSVKSNIGHCESAAGIAGLTKVMLQMQHQQIVPSLHSEQLNPHIDFDNTPFVVSQSLKRWDQPVIDGRTVPRIAGISSFGAGGSNAHMIVEEYRPPVPQPVSDGPVAIVLSARTNAQLQQKARDLLDFVRPRLTTVDLPEVAYTLQTGREPMEERLGLVVSSAEQLTERLEAYLAGDEAIGNVSRGQARRHDDALSLFDADADLQQTIDRWIANRKVSKLLDAWVKGLDLDWTRLYGDQKPARASLPTYPFAKERYWVDVPAGGHVSAGSGASSSLHPLLHTNTSDLSEQRYASTFTGQEFFLADHQFKANGGAGQRMLPGVAHLEMARAAIEHALPGRSESAGLELHNVVWAQPIVANGKTEVNVALSAGDNDQIDYEIYSQDGDQEIVHCQGHAVWSEQPAAVSVDLERLKAQTGERSLEPHALYAACARMGLVYGPAFRPITALQRGSGQVMAALRLPDVVAGTSGDYVLHPSVMDGAVQAAAGLIEGELESQPPRLPFALDTLRILSPCTRDMTAWVRFAAESQAADRVVKVDIDVCDERGNVCVQMRGLSSREVGGEIAASAARSQAIVAAPDISTGPAQGQPIGTLVAIPVWQASPRQAPANGRARDYARHDIIVCELREVDTAKLASLVPANECVSLDGGEQPGIAQRYSDYALASFDRVQSLLQARASGRVLVQVVVADRQDGVTYAGLSGMLRTAALENPQFAGQLILVPPNTTTEQLATQVQAERFGALEPMVRYTEGAREVQGWQEVADDGQPPPVAFKEHAVYLISGGLGGLGLIFTREILTRTNQGTVVLIGRSPLSAEKRAVIEDLSGRTGRVAYRQVDVADLVQVSDLVSSVREEHGRLDGILHAAGLIADSFILKKGRAEFSQVLAPKVTGTFNLDLASQDAELDFFVLFSSVTGPLGNPGQADYAVANGFLDQFAAYRNREVAAHRRHGRTRTINWPLWRAGGMHIDAASEELLKQTTGMQPMQTSTGIAAFYRSLALPYDRTLIAEGDLAKMRRMLPAGPPVVPVQPPSEPTEPAASKTDSSSLVEKTQDYLRREFSELMKLPAHRIDSHAPLEQYGIDSILAMRLTNQLEKTFGSLSKTLFYEYQTLAGLARYLVKAHRATVEAAVGLTREAATPLDGHVAATDRPPTVRARSRRRFARSATHHGKDIAVVGVAGRYPQAEDLEEFWGNLRDGRDCITEIPPDRWDHALYYDARQNTPGKSYGKWGGFIADVDKFDPLFFNISPKEAALIDPQERLFLQTAWHTVEDAGYTKEAMAGRRVGVFVGVMWGHYELLGAESILAGHTAVPSSSHASIANRVSYFFDFHGPSIAVDTMCSSSLTAIHLACEELRKGEIEAAIAGGVNVTIHPYKYLSLSQGKFAASDGRCRSFGAGGDGYVPGEGVGAVLLKRLEDALRDGDQIYAVIKSSTVNHGGKTNGYTVPNPNAQGALILDALKKANVDASTLSYVEAHGTGTSLGDPIEITGLLQAFEGSSVPKQSCPIGSVKSNIGHLESAAGIAALTKVLLQIRHSRLVPSLHADPLNPHINFEDSPFYVQRELKEWTHPAGHPRRVGVSSFGAGGSNAYLIVEEYPDSRRAEPASESSEPQAFVLSARDRDSLRRYAERAAAYLQNVSGTHLADIAYTSQTGRTAMSARMVVIAHTVDELRRKLTEWAALQANQGTEPGSDAGEPEDVFVGDVRTAPFSASSLIEGRAGKAFLEQLLANRDLTRVGRLWVLGADVDWSLLHRQATRRKVSLPTYPFAKERCWIEQPAMPPATRPDAHRARSDAREAGEEKRRTYYYPRWAPKAIGAETPKGRAEGPILTLDLSQQLCDALKRQMENGSTTGPLVLLEPGTTFQETGPSVYVVDPAREEQFDELVETLKDRGELPGVVLHHCAQACSLEERETVALQLNRTVYALLYLSKALMKQKHQAPVRILSVVATSEDGPAPLGTAIAGFLRSLTLENPRYLARVVDIESGPEDRGMSLDETAGLIRDELFDDDWTTTEIRYRWTSGEDGPKRGRFVRELVCDEPVATEASLVPFRQDGVYLITGGLGGLGLIFAQHLAGNFRSKLVLVGRSAFGPAQREKVGQLERHGAKVAYVQADVSRLEDLEKAVREAKARFGELNGVIHAAGVNRDAFVLRKTKAEVEAVLAPKVYGAINVDLATSGEALDWFVLCSSVAGTLGNVGQSDYAYANRFLDSFAERREHLRGARKRAGRTLAISWPLWEEGGMGISREDLARLQDQTGMFPLPTQDGIRYLEDFLRSDAAQAIALYGVPSRIAAYVARSRRAASGDTSAAAKDVDAATLLVRTETYLKGLIAEEIKLAADRIGSSERFESFGIDSVMINRLNASLARDLGDLPKTVFYEYETVAELARFLLREAREPLVALSGLAASEGESDARPAGIEEEVIRSNAPAAPAHDRSEPIAIIGIHGTYPHSRNLVEYWENLRQGKDLIDLVPPDRWDYEEFYDPDPEAASRGRIYCKWGGFLDGHDKFDPRFFNISTEEAGIMDPQERLFLESVWAAIEDAGYTRESLKKRFSKGRSADVGVFVGVTTNSYHLLATEEGNGQLVRPTALPWSIANRVSYFFDFNGPSMPVDTACSSSLVAVHLACESLRRGECQVAVAGGVNLYLHPSKYHSLCRGRMLSVDGKCHSYGAGGDGFVPGEGVGTMVLKPLCGAIADQDRIHAVIRGSGFDHSGRSNGYSAPNPNAQAALISRVLEKAAIHAESIGYVEGHGTGTQLGDSLEVAALSQAFGAHTAKQRFCPLGSVKANIGHSESAAGIAGLTKVILQLEHRELVPSIHSDVVNPNIEFDASPFYLQRQRSEWPSSAGAPRRALVNSFGAGGVNACVVVEEYRQSNGSDGPRGNGPHVFTLSARNEERLRDYVGSLVIRLRRGPAINLADLCYTLQVGREPMEHRLATVVSTVEELADRLDEWSTRGSAAAVHHGTMGRLPKRPSNPAMSAAETENPDVLASMWVAGEDIDWERRYREAKPRRIDLPTYPFAQERYWVPDFGAPDKRPLPDAQMHPLVSYNSSTLREVSFSSMLSDTAFYAVDHKVNEEGIFPGAGFLEMACISGNIAGDQRVRKIKDVVWIQPLSFRRGCRTLRTVLTGTDGGVEYVISSFDDENEPVVHSEGRLAFGNGRPEPADGQDCISIQALKARCRTREDGTTYYRHFTQYGIEYGPAFRSIQEIYVDESFALSKLKIPDHLQRDFGRFILHPTLIDGALQTAAGLVGGLESATPYLPFAVDEVDIVHPLPETCYAYAERADSPGQDHAGARTFDIRLVNENGAVLVTLRNLFIRPLTGAQAADRADAAALAAC